MHLVRFIVRKLTSFELSSISGGISFSYSHNDKRVIDMTPFDFAPFAAAAACGYGAYQGLSLVLETNVCTKANHPYLQAGLFGLGVAASAVSSFVGVDYLKEQVRNYF